MADPLPIGVTVELEALEGVLDETQKAAADLRPVFRGVIAPSIAGNLEQQFASRGSWLGEPWAPLSPTTVRLRTRVVRRRGGAKATTSRVGQARAGFTTPMRNTNRLFGSLVRLSHPEGVRLYEPGRMVWGTALPYAEGHHRPTGFQTRLFGKGPLRTVPPRPVVPREWPASIVAKWSGAITSHVGGF